MKTELQTSAAGRKCCHRPQAVRWKWVTRQLMLTEPREGPQRVSTYHRGLVRVTGAPAVTGRARAGRAADGGGYSSRDVGGKPPECCFTAAFHHLTHASGGKMSAGSQRGGFPTCVCDVTGVTCRRTRGAEFSCGPEHFSSGVGCVCF